jgi:hypothetical protein
MSGRVLGDATRQLTRTFERVRIPIDRAAYDRLRRDGSALVSFETPDGEVQAFDVRLSRGRG